MHESTKSILVKHQIKTTLRTIYVEGPTDLVFYRKCLQALNVDNVRIFDISTVDLSDFPYNDHRLDFRQNRDKVRALGFCLDRGSLKNVAGVIDADFDILNGEASISPNVYSTDVSCAEAYFWNTSAFIDFLNLVTKGKVADKISILGDALNGIFSVRLVKSK